MGVKVNAKNLYVGVDLGGTKIQASLIKEDGAILASERISTPMKSTPRQILQAVAATTEELMQKHLTGKQCVKAMGIAVPGVVDVAKGRVVIAPNLNFSHVQVVSYLQKKLQLPVALGNDTNAGILGETWLGAARNCSSAVGIFVGTGIGGGFVQEGQLWRGAREVALEIGHMVMQVGGPLCGCGSHGCFEAMAGRLAIARDIRQAVRKGQKTILTKILDGNLSRIRSGALRKALAKHDPLVTRVMHHAAEVMGYACLNVRHLFDPEKIVLGGGVMEACGDYIMPIVQKIIAQDPMKGAGKGGQVVPSVLGDDAVVLGAIVLARQMVQRSPI